MNPTVYFVENLTLRAWVFSIWPRLMMNRISGNRISRCYVIDGSLPAMLTAKVSALLAGTPVRRLEFYAEEVRDEAGLGVRLRIRHQDLAEAQKYAVGLPEFQESVDTRVHQDRLPMFLAKNITDVRVRDRNIVWRALNLVHLSIWTMKRDGSHSGNPVLFLERLPWLSVVTHCGAENGVAVIPVMPALGVAASVRGLLPAPVRTILRALRYRRYRQLLSSIRQLTSSPSGKGVKDGAGSSAEHSGHGTKIPGPYVGIEYYGQFNLDRPECFSDLFFWQCSSLKGKDVLVTFGIPRDPLDGVKWAQLQEHGISAVALNPGATTISDVPVFNRRLNFNGTHNTTLLTRRNELERAWIKNQISNYNHYREYWTRFFDQYNIKVYLTWYKYDGLHYAIADALQSLGGVTAIYQRAYESNPSTECAIGADIGFGYSHAVAEVERRSNSSIRYHVATGYLGDHRFNLIRAQASTLRDQLKQQGAKHILAFFDENSVDEHRFAVGHRFTQENYQFLLEKVLAHPWLGLVIKPKTPATLRQRLGPVAPLLEKAEATGRCFVHEDGLIQGSYPPAAAALAADVAIHGHLHAATAGIDAALAGVPTLMLDREGWSLSPIYRLGVGRVVFNDWEDLWQACQLHWSASDGVPGFGDWSPMLDEFDPFRDGRAAERMGTYVKWLIEGFQAGQDREIVMADAAERYCSIWGKDKVAQINGGLQALPHPSAGGQCA